MKTKRAFERGKISENEQERRLKQRRTSAPEARRTYSVEEAGRILGICRNSAYALAKSGELPTVRLGRRLLVPCAALERLLANA